MRGRVLLTATLVLFSFPIMSSCGYQGYYRYPCQDPENWENEECQRPLCEIGSGCSDELTGISTNE